MFVMVDRSEKEKGENLIFGDIFSPLGRRDAKSLFEKR